MDPTMMNRLGLIRQQELLEQAERSRNETPIWELLSTWGGALLRRLPKPALSVSRKRAAAPDMTTECC